MYSRHDRLGLCVQMEAFYASSGFKDRRFRIVAGADPALAARCGVYDSSRHMWLSTQPQNKDKVLLKSMKDAPNLLAFVYRQVRRRGGGGLITIG